MTKIIQKILSIFSCIFLCAILNGSHISFAQSPAASFRFGELPFVWNVNDIEIPVFVNSSQLISTVDIFISYPSEYLTFTGAVFPGQLSQCTPVSAVTITEVSSSVLEIKKDNDVLLGSNACLGVAGFQVKEGTTNLQKSLGFGFTNLSTWKVLDANLQKITPSFANGLIAKSCFMNWEGDIDCSNTIDLLDFEEFRSTYIQLKNTSALDTQPGDIVRDHRIDLLDFSEFRNGYIRYATKLAKPADACWYIRVQCITAPCSPILYCPSVSITPTVRNTPTPSIKPTSGVTIVPSITAVPVYSYKDGSYSATGSYSTEGGRTESILVSLTVKSDIVTALTVTNKANNNTSSLFQNKFISGINTLVIGKRLADVASIGKVNGSSDTPAGFNNAIKVIQLSAKI